MVGAQEWRRIVIIYPSVAFPIRILLRSRRNGTREHKPAVESSGRNEENLLDVKRMTEVRSIDAESVPKKKDAVA